MVTAPPIPPSINADVTSGSVPLVVNFTGYEPATYEVNYIEWDYGDDSTNDYATWTPTHVYNVPGVYDVNLYVENILSFASTTESAYITVTGGGSLPVTDFTVSDASVNCLEQITFTDTTTNYPTTWNWNFGDTETSTLQNPVHSYENPGTYTVALEAANWNGSDTETKTGYITITMAPYAPVVAFSATPLTYATLPTSVTFTDESTNGPTSWQWNFGDGYVSSDQNPTHNYTVSGSYTVTLIATNTYGDGTLTKTNYIIVGDYSSTLTKLKVKRATTTTWESVTTPHYLDGGELGYDKTVKQLRIGNSETESTAFASCDLIAGGSSYTAGYGIDITDDEISVDTLEVATQGDIPTLVSELTNDSGYITGLDHNDTTNIQGGDTDEYYHLDEATYNTVATTGDIPTYIGGTGIDVAGTVISADETEVAVLPETWVESRYLKSTAVEGTLEWATAGGTGAEYSPGFGINIADYIISADTNEMASVDWVTAQAYLQSVSQDTLPALGGDLYADSHKITSLATPETSYDAANKIYVDQVALGLAWQEPVLDIIEFASLPPAPTIGDRYIIEDDNDIAVWQAPGQWYYYTPATGWAAWVTDDIYVPSNDQGYFVFNGALLTTFKWVSIGSTITHNILSGLQGGELGQYYHLDANTYNTVATTGDIPTYTAGYGINLVANEISVDSLEFASIPTGWADEKILKTTAAEGTFEFVDAPTDYTLPIASGGTLGGIKVGTRLSIDGSGILSADAQGGSYTAGYGIDIVADEISVDTLVVASHDWVTEQGYLTTLAHNDTTSIQGGDVDEYYHLDADTYNNVATTGDIQTYTEGTGINIAANVISVDNTEVAVLPETWVSTRYLKSTVVEGTLEWATAGGTGSEYSPGYGIDIADYVISADSNEVASLPPVWESGKFLLSTGTEGTFEWATTFVPQVTKVLYVDKNRTDTYTPDGSIDKPFLTIGAATAVSTINTVIIATSGSYTETVVLGEGVSLEGYGAITFYIIGNVITDDAGYSSLKYINITGNLTLQSHCILEDIHVSGKVISNGSVTVTSRNVYFISGSGNATLTIGFGNTFKVDGGAIYNSGDAAAISSSGLLELNTAFIEGTRVSDPLILMNNGQLNIYESTLHNLGNGPSIDLTNSSTSESLPNIIGNVVSRGSIVGGDTYTIVDGLHFVTTGTLTGTNLNFSPSSRLDNDSSVTGDTIKDALETLESLATYTEGYGIDIIDNAISVDTLEFASLPQPWESSKYLKSTIIDGTLEWATISSDEVTIPTIGTPAIDTLTEYMNSVGFTGFISGGVISDGGSGKASVTAGTGFIRTTDSITGDIKSFAWSENTALDLVNESINYIYVDYNGGTPIIKTTTTRSDIKFTNMFSLGQVYRDGPGGDVLSILQSGTNICNIASRLQEMELVTEGFSHVSGAIISCPTGLKIQSTEGNFYSGLNPITTPAQDTSGSDTFTYWCRSATPNEWIQTTAQTDLIANNYDDGTGTPGTIDNGTYSTHYIYVMYDGTLHVQYGQNDANSLIAAQIEQPPTAPALLNNFAVLSAKVIILYDASTPADIQSSWNIPFVGSTAVSHTDLTNLSYAAAGHTGFAPSNPLATDSLWDAAGDLVYGTGANTAGRLGKGADGTYLKSGSSTLEWATVSGEIYLSMAGGWTGTTLPDGGFVTTETSTNKVNFKGTNFAASANDQFHEFGCLMPRNYNGGTIIAKFTFFVPTSTDASNHTIILGLQGVCFGDGDAGDAAYGTVQTVTETIASSIAGKVIITANTPAITIAGTPGAGKWVQFRVYREGDDTFAGDLTCLGCMITYTTTGL